MTKAWLRLELLVSLALAGCATQVRLPVIGAFDSPAADKFLGSVTADLSTGVGQISVNTQQGAACAGSYVQARDNVTGKGTLTCADGRTGDFIYTSRGLEGEGFGKLQTGETFSFKFGSRYHTEQRAREGAALGEGLQSLGQSLKSPPSTRTDCFTNAGMTTCTTR